MKPTPTLRSPQGFGDPAGEHWLGNEVMHQLTGRTAYSLRVELQDWEGNEAYAQYEHFQLGSEGQLYRWARGPGWWAGWGPGLVAVESAPRVNPWASPVPTICPPFGRTSRDLEAAG